MLSDGLVGVDLRPQTGLGDLPAVVGYLFPGLLLLDVLFPLGDEVKHQKDEEGSQSKEHRPHQLVGAT